MSIRRFKKKLTVLLGINPPGLVSLVREPKIIAIENEMIKDILKRKKYQLCIKNTAEQTWKQTHQVEL